MSEGKLKNLLLLLSRHRLEQTLGREGERERERGTRGKQVEKANSPERAKPPVVGTTIITIIRSSFLPAYFVAQLKGHT